MACRRNYNSPCIPASESYDNIGATCGTPGCKLCNRRREEYYKYMSRQDVMSMLIHGTYFRDLRRREKFVAWKLGYTNERAEMYGKLHWVAYPCQASMSELQNLGLAFLRPKHSHRNSNAPRLAIVLRGTIPTYLNDLSSDLDIAVAQLNKSDRVRRTMELILQVVQEFLRENPEQQICMAGHSLGAAIALIVGGLLYSTHNIYIDTHLFNPPLLTVVDTLSGRAFPEPTPPDRDPELEVIFSKLKEALVGNRPEVIHEWDQFQRLLPWLPHFYLNPGDPICRQYIKFYKRRHPVKTPGDVISWQGLLSGLFTENATYFKNVVPSAVLHISYWQEGNLRLAHSLQQWHNEFIHPKVSSVRLF